MSHRFAYVSRGTVFYSVVKKILARAATVITIGMLVVGAAAEERVSIVITQPLETDRVTIRPFSPNDWHDVQRLALDWRSAPGPEFDKWPTGDADVRGLTNYFADRSDTYLAIALREDGKVVGLLGLHGIDDTGEFDLGHVILSKYQDNDTDRHALGIMVDQIFSASDVAAIITRNADHAPQLAPLKSLGFVKRNPDSGGELALSRERWAERNQP